MLIYALADKLPERDTILNIIITDYTSWLDDLYLLNIAEGSTWFNSNPEQNRFLGLAIFLRMHVDDLV